MFWPFNRMKLDGEDVGLDRALDRARRRRSSAATPAGRWSTCTGEIVGVNEISLGLAGAIPADLAREVADGDHRDGRVERAGSASTSSRC